MNVGDLYIFFLNLKRSHVSVFLIEKYKKRKKVQWNIESLNL